MNGGIKRGVDWLLRDRRTGEVTLGQPPNVPLLIGLGGLGARWLLQPDGAWDVVLAVVGYGAMLFWAGDEVLRGVNPFRRILGGTVLAGLVTSLVTR